MPTKKYQKKAWIDKIKDQPQKLSLVTYIMVILYYCHVPIKLPLKIFLNGGKIKNRNMKIGSFNGQGSRFEGKNRLSCT